MKNVREVNLVLIILLIMVALLSGCRNIQKNIDTTVIIEDRVANTKTTTHTVDKSKDESFTLGLSEGDGKVIDVLDINVSGVNTQ